MTVPRSTITEDLTAQVDGLATTFAIAGGPFIAGTLVVEHNGLRLRPVFDFAESGTSAFVAMFAPRIGDSLLVQFEIEDFGAGFPLVVAFGIDPT